MKGYCVKCKKKIEFTVTTKSKMKNGATLNKGKCPICGTTVCTFTK